MINDFNGAYRFLSNYYHPCSVVYKGVKYANSESAYQAQKCPLLCDSFTHIGPDTAKHLGRDLHYIRDDWDDIKYQVMLDIVRAKFEQHPKLAKKLIATGRQKLVEGNTWGDMYWGQCYGVGYNNLGNILMQVRSELKRKTNGKRK